MCEPDSVTGGRKDSISDANYVFVASPASVSSSGFGGGLPVLEARSTPGDQDSATPPPLPSHGGTVEVNGEFCDDPLFFFPPPICCDATTQTDDYCVFSAKTCLELLDRLTDKQLDFELKHFDSKFLRPWGITFQYAKHDSELHQ